MLSRLLLSVRTEQAPAPPEQGHAARTSVESLVVVLAGIIIVAVLAGMLARICGGRRLVSGGGGDHDLEGWVERRCRSCMDSGIPPPPPQAAGGAKK
ncbi:hypothetical protein KSP39_PZI012226 [Platanthera zijinensis]|uniref:Uncharacterized protein n=1 Tax=Platanthera zijinensis TaxID=2320716 RepID=A0AAP0G4I3_9ASPA